MKKTLLFIGMTILLASASITTQAAQDDNLVYVAVTPCRIADTRSSFDGVIAANTSRKFLVSGAAGVLNNQGGNTAGCVHPRAGSGLEPVAISAYIVAVPTATSTNGLLTAFPSDQADPSDAIATVNFATGQIVGNTTTATLCQGSSCPAAGPLAIITHNTEQHVVIDVQGYFYPAQSSCPSDMVAAGSVCIDKYEASLWTAPTGGTQLNLAGPTPGTDDIVCNNDGSDCGATAANPIYALSIASVLPAARITLYQAEQACANVGKRLPTTAEWQMAASGTPSGTGGGCNAGSGTVANTDANTTCVSSAGALNMVGNVWELTADLDNPTLTAGTVISSDSLFGVSYGQDFANSGGGTPSTKSGFVVAPGDDTNGKVGFRCAR